MPTAQELYEQAISLDFLKKFHEGIYITQIGLVPMIMPAGSDGLSLMATAAEQGYASAQYQLSLYYLFEHEHRNAAVSHIENKFDQHDALKHLEQDEQHKGLSLLQAAAQQNHGEACLLLGDIFYENRFCGGRPFNFTPDNRQAFLYYQKGALAGCEDAMYRAGCCYYYGEGTTEDNEAAFSMLEQAQQAGCTLAWALLGDCYMNAYGTHANIPKAISYLSKDLSDSHSGFHDSSTVKLACIYRGERGFQYANLTKARELLVSVSPSSDIYSIAQQMLQEMPQVEREYLAWQQQSQPRPASTPTSTSSTSGPCYVATAVYGSYDCPEVWTLRRFRDYALAASWYGRAFIRLYYTVSPTLVKHFGNAQWFKDIWKPFLDRLVASLKQKGMEDTPYTDRPW